MNVVSASAIVAGTVVFHSAIILSMFAWVFMKLASFILEKSTVFGADDSGIILSVISTSVPS